MRDHTRKSEIAAVASGIGAWLIPVGICPACWPAYAGTASALGLGFTLKNSFLTELSVFLLLVSIGALAIRARKRHSYGPLALGACGAITVLTGKRWFVSDLLSYIGLSAIVAAGFWNSWPTKTACTGVCPITTKEK